MRRMGLALLLLSLSAERARADDAAAYVPPDFMKEPPPLPAAFDGAQVWRLDLAEALRIAVHQNLGLAIERQQVAIAEHGIDVAGGAFEPQISASYQRGRSEAPAATKTDDANGDIVTSTSDDWSLGVSQRLPTGTRLAIDFVNGRQRSTSAAAIDPLVYRSSASVSVTQPLLRGFSLDLEVPRLDVLRAELASERERQALLVTAVDVVERTEAAYWDVVQALYRYDLDVRSHKRAEDQLALTHRQIAAGLLPTSDLIAAESTVAQRKLGLLQAEQAIEAASDRLRAVLNLPRDQWSRPLLPTEAPRFVAQERTPEDALAIAIKQRPELAQLALDVRSQELVVRKAENDQLPQIDLGLSATLTGQDGRFGGALDQIGRADATGYAVQLNLTWTPLRRATAAAAEIERARQRIAIVRRDQTLQDVWVSVRDGVRAQRSAARQVAAAARFRELATQSLDVEQRRFLSGTSSNFFVAQRQEELANAQLSELTAVLSYKKASAALLRATGQLLAERHVELVVRPAR